MQLETTMLSEIDQIHKIKYVTVSFIWEKQNINKLKSKIREEIGNREIDVLQ